MLISLGDVPVGRRKELVVLFLRIQAGGECETRDCNREHRTLFFSRKAQTYNKLVLSARITLLQNTVPNEKRIRVLDGIGKLTNGERLC